MMHGQKNIEFVCVEQYLQNFFMMMMMIKIIIIIIIIAVSGDRRLIIKETENILKYEDLTMEIHRMWIVKTKVTPVK